MYTHPPLPPYYIVSLLINNIPVRVEGDEVE